MNTRGRIVPAVVILLIGVGVAYLFRKPAPSAESPPAGEESATSLVNRAPVEPPEAAPPRSRLVGRIDPWDPAAACEVRETRPEIDPSPRRDEPVDRFALERESSLPRLAPEYPGSAIPAEISPEEYTYPEDVPGLAEREAEAAGAAEEEAERTLVHKVSDGDTLASLAAQYLGDSRRFREIYAANREVLENPDLLPIGAELKIPTSSSHTASTVEPRAPGRLVPVPWGRRR